MGEAFEPGVLDLGAGGYGGEFFRGVEDRIAHGGVICADEVFEDAHAGAVVALGGDEGGAAGGGLGFGGFFLEGGHGADFDAFTIFLEESVGGFEGGLLDGDGFAGVDQVVVGLFDLEEGDHELLLEVEFGAFEVFLIDFDGGAEGVDPEITEEWEAEFAEGGADVVLGGIEFDEVGAEELGPGGFALGEADSEAVAHAAGGQVTGDEAAVLVAAVEEVGGGGWESEGLVVDTSGADAAAAADTEGEIGVVGAVGAFEVVGGDFGAAAADLDVEVILDGEFDAVAQGEIEGRACGISAERGERGDG